MPTQTRPEIAEKKMIQREPNMAFLRKKHLSGLKPANADLSIAGVCTCTKASSSTASPRFKASPSSLSKTSMSLAMMRCYSATSTVRRSKASSMPRTPIQADRAIEMQPHRSPASSISTLLYKASIGMLEECPTLNFFGTIKSPNI